MRTYIHAMNSVNKNHNRQCTKPIDLAITSGIFLSGAGAILLTVLMALGTGRLLANVLRHTQPGH